MTTLAAHQPQYLPWLGFFDKVAQADVFVLLDNVQFKKNEWQNRNRIKGATGPQWITVPVQHRFPQTIAEVEVRDTEPWRRKHLRALDSNYRRAAHFEEVMAPIAAILEQPQTQLAPLNIELVRRLMQQLGIETTMVLGSEVEARCALRTRRTGAVDCRAHSATESRDPRGSVSLPGRRRTCRAPAAPSDGSRR